jgi:hypothetical protein
VVYFDVADKFTAEAQSDGEATQRLFLIFAVAIEMS